MPVPVEEYTEKAFNKKLIFWIFPPLGYSGKNPKSPCFSKQQGANIQNNTSKLVPLLPGTNLGPVCVGDT